MKIDGSFILDLPDNPANMIFIRSLLDLARNFGLDTVAECVETMEQADTLLAEGVGFLQGWAFGRPQFEVPWSNANKDPEDLGAPATKIQSVGR